MYSQKSPKAVCVNPSNQVVALNQLVSTFLNIIVDINMYLVSVDIILQLLEYFFKLQCELIVNHL